MILILVDIGCLELGDWLALAPKINNYCIWCECMHIFYIHTEPYHWANMWKTSHELPTEGCVSGDGRQISVSLYLMIPFISIACHGFQFKWLMLEFLCSHPLGINPPFQVCSVI